MGRKRNRRELGAAWAADEPVRAKRSIWKADLIEGFVVDLADEWVVFHVVYDIGLNGWSAVRLDTIADVDRQSNASFLARALAWAGDEPEAIAVDLASPRTLVESLSATFPLVTVFTEAVDPAVCAIGRPVRLGKNKLHLLDISSDAEWDDEPRRFRYEDITRIDVGGRYETALHHLGGYPPVPS